MKTWRQAGANLLFSVLLAACVAAPPMPRRQAMRTDRDHYRLVAAEGDTLPVVISTRAPCREELVEGTLDLVGGAYQLALATRERCADFTTEPITEVRVGSFVQLADSLRLRSSVSDDSVLGRVAGDTVRLQLPIAGRVIGLLFRAAEPDTTDAEPTEPGARRRRGD
mgnify:CR=1 FL=1